VQSADEFAADVLFACGHHLAEDGRAFGFRNPFLARVTCARESKRRVVHGQIDVF